jgi:hypothetical protein
MWNLTGHVHRLRALTVARHQAHVCNEERALELLKANLSAAQLQEYKRSCSFEVVGGSTGLRYRILQGHQLNVEQLDVKGRRTCVLCFTPEGALPIGDVMLAQKLALELFETDALKVANKAPLNFFSRLPVGT